MLISVLKNSLAKKRGPLYAVISLLCLVVIAGALLPAGQAHAFSPNYNPSNLIDNPTLLNSSAMNAGQIQAFLSSEGSGLAGYSDVEACDSTIAPYYSHCGQTISAAQIIYDSAQAYGINPRAILATLEKEQSLPTDPSPSASQINCAMGYNSCSGYVGFFTQVDNGTWIIRYNYEGAAGHATWLSWHPGGNYPCANAHSGFYSAGLYPGNTVTFADSGGTPETVTLANAATASFYCYTPYVGPYSVTGYSGSYNFVYYYQLWFGATQTSTPYAWAYQGQQIYSDSGYSQALSSVDTVAPGGTVYAQIKARNIGYQTWTPSVVHLGTSDPMDHTSGFYDSSWLGQNRPAALLESSVVPGDTGTFDFKLHAPATPGTYYEYFNPLAEGVMWMNDLGLYFTINVVAPISAPNNTNTGLASGATLNVGQYLLSPDAQSVLTLQTDSNLVYYSNYKPAWYTSTVNQSASRLVMQPDGNLVLYNSSNVALWSAQTQGHAGAYLTLQTDGNMVVYSSTNQALWATYSVNSPDHLSFVNSSMSNARLYVGQELDTANRKYRLVLQGDGNLVLYDSNYHPLWYSRTDGRGTSNLVVQPDGNLVIYSAGGATWASNTVGQ